MRDMIHYVFWPHCDGEEKVLATNRNGQSIVSVFKACTSIGTQVSQSIQLVTATGRRKNILVYEPNGGVIGCKGKTFPGDAEPSAEWCAFRRWRTVDPGMTDSLGAKRRKLCG